ncbi:macrolide ABC transporter permease/ATP-binding protein MacB [Alteromonas confluentis]|uniref:Macrolide ABC transporter permease/ATP-binding protein MacB n=1 Tax=Alteromonas confluentis TaxID=1656094 RepID=A0A1E7Z875_9ALTE|nr:macrolide ABC transporter permease/ATP-binding protein MacB [Alteromonas confluentis]
MKAGPEDLADHRGCLVGKPSLIELNNVVRSYQTEGTEVRALDGISLTIRKGEFVAIMGQSGSGKSTLMNILGCLDTPSAGSYTINGHNVNSLTQEQLSALRLKTFGFVFQRYQLLASHSAIENVALPAIYSNTDKPEREKRAAELLTRLGLGDRLEHRPGEMSGGQQQRVSVARALINGAEVILADEPTGALDSASGEQLLALLKELHGEGVTIILITHDPAVAEHAERQVHLLDGKIVSDSGEAVPEETPQEGTQGAVQAFRSISGAAALGMAFSSLRLNWFRTLLTLLGIIIGVAAVVTMMAIGEGGKQDVLKRIEAIGTNLISVRPGGRNMRNSGDVATLTLADADALRDIPGVMYVAPERSSRNTMRYGENDFSGRIKGSTPDYLHVKDWEIAQGVFFTEEDVRNYAPVVVIGDTVAETLFEDKMQAVGKYILMSNSLYQVIGVLKSKGATAGGSDQDDEVLIPVTTGRLKVFGRDYLSGITIKASGSDVASQVKDAVLETLKQRHGAEDVMVFTTDSLVEAVTETQNTLTWLLASVAAISLFVGGIGVMNIMLVNVSERKREIGLRMATGAKPADILKQFNIEAWVVCILGGAVGIVLGYGVILIVSQFSISVAYTLMPPVLAFITSLLVGVLFGYAPALKASRLSPIEALSED